MAGDARVGSMAHIMKHPIVACDKPDGWSWEWENWWKLLPHHRWEWIPWMHDEGKRYYDLRSVWRWGPLTHRGGV